ncbi:MAG: group 1 truncated hemoglobin [Alphaproteobacteria bacterium]|jgi:hemoglobin|nr:group 1 truncated hemoglobin [Alphaproteobacteria bacterium]MBT4017163.1 group 1 truncated hemoglobin [Alphaproteobacteria bacterium]MBT4966249.1 group 1 truncated hemoglobin [Alphaproteobacteria bacterium]MBT5159188.1 group 1 truncated hemoglobin [Alphaproteobacteria bacterium]MBT5917095.1 group 1 truncated hemoglobin [Alphaproteobacteria bacterium]
MAFFEEVGGKPVIERVHTLLYNKLLSHPWLKGYFVGVRRSHLEDQQTDFMSDLFGVEPKVYFGRFPMPAHQHLFITEEVFMVRHKLLADSLIEAKISAEHQERWLKYDMGMKRTVVKTSVDECEKRYNSDTIIDIPKPAGM